MMLLQQISSTMRLNRLFAVVVDVCAAYIITFKLKINNKKIGHERRRSSSSGGSRAKLGQNANKHFLRMCVCISYDNVRADAWRAFPVVSPLP